MIDYVRNSHIIGVVDGKVFMAADTPKKIRILYQNKNEDVYRVLFEMEYEFEVRCQSQRCCGLLSLAFYAFNKRQTHIYAFVDRFTILRIDITDGTFQFYGSSISDKIKPPFCHHCYFCQQTSMRVVENGDSVEMLIYDRLCQSSSTYQTSNSFLFIAATRNHENAVVEKLAFKLPYTKIKFATPTNINGTTWAIVFEKNKVVIIEMLENPIIKKTNFHSCNHQTRKIYKILEDLCQKQCYLLFENQKLGLVFSNETSYLEFYNLEFKKFESIYRITPTNYKYNFHPIFLNPFKNIPTLSSTNSSFSSESSESSDTDIFESEFNVLMAGLVVISGQTGKVQSALKCLNKEAINDNCKCQHCINRRRSSVSTLISETVELRRRIHEMSFWERNEVIMEEEPSTPEILQNLDNSNPNTTTTIDDVSFNSNRTARSTILVETPLLMVDDSKCINYAQLITKDSTNAIIDIDDNVIHNNKERRSTIFLNSVQSNPKLDVKINHAELKYKRIEKPKYQTCAKLLINSPKMLNPSFITRKTKAEPDCLKSNNQVDLIELSQTDEKDKEKQTSNDYVQTRYSNDSMIKCLALNSEDLMNNAEDLGSDTSFDRNTRTTFGILCSVFEK